MVLILIAAALILFVTLLFVAGGLSRLQGAVTLAQGLQGGFTNADGSLTQNTAGFPTANDTFSVGTTAKGTANLVDSSTVAVTYGSPITYDLTALTLNNFNTTDDFARVKEILVQNVSTVATTTITISGGGSNPFNGWFAASWAVTLLPGESLKIGGNTALGQVVSSSQKTLLLTNNDSTPNLASVAILIVGSNA